MNLKINGIGYELHFGLDFISYLDKKYYVSQGSFKLGQGMTMAISYIEMGNPVILLDLIAAGTITGKAKPAPADIIKYIEEEANIEVLMEDFLSAFEKAPTTHFMMKKLGKLSETAKA